MISLLAAPQRDNRPGCHLFAGRDAGADPLATS